VRVRGLGTGRHVLKIVYAGSDTLEARTVKVRIRL